MNLFEIANINIEANLEEYLDFLKNYVQELQKYSQEKDIASEEEIGYTEEQAEEDIQRISQESIESTKKFKSKIENLINKENWNISNIMIVPYFNEEQFSFEPIVDFQIFVGTNKEYKNNPSITVFNNGKEIEDILDAGDTDFFDNPEVEADYFTLVGLLRNKPVSNKILKLYTARPSKDHNLFQNAKEISPNIFLTNKLSEAEGYSLEYQDREIWSIWIQERYLLQTLDRNNIKNYQTYNKGSSIPIERIQLIS